MLITATVLSAWFDCKIDCKINDGFCISLINVMSFTITCDFKIYWEKLSFQTNLPNLILFRHPQVLRQTVWPSPLVNWPLLCKKTHFSVFSNEVLWVQICDATGCFVKALLMGQNIVLDKSHTKQLGHISILEHCKPQ